MYFNRIGQTLTVASQPYINKSKKGKQEAVKLRKI